MNPKAVALILQLVSSKEGRNGLKNTLIGLVSALAVFVLLIAAVIKILMSPFAWIGELGIFQKENAYLVAAEIVEYGEPLSDAEIDALVVAVTDDQDRVAILQTALSLVGRASYSQGGESPDYGLDSSGFVAWVWETAEYQSIGNSITAQFMGSTAINEVDLLPGDLAFMDAPGGENNHVGIYYGEDPAGKKLFIHCSAGAGGVVMDTYSYNDFHFFRQPVFSKIIEENEEE